MLQQGSVASSTLPSGGIIFKILGMLKDHTFHTLFFNSQIKVSIKGNMQYITIITEGKIFQAKIQKEEEMEYSFERILSVKS